MGEGGSPSRRVGGPARPAPGATRRPPHPPPGTQAPGATPPPPSHFKRRAAGPRGGAGQAKFVTWVGGRALDIAVDIRVGSPTFGHYDLTHQTPESGTAVYLPDGIGHAFLALTDDTCMCYLCSTEYEPGTMIEIHALDPDLALPWGLTERPTPSAQDAPAPSLAD